jgi:hypothetical protein
MPIIIGLGGRGYLKEDTPCRGVYYTLMGKEGYY